MVEQPRIGERLRGSDARRSGAAAGARRRALRKASSLIAALWPLFFVPSARAAGQPQTCAAAPPPAASAGIVNPVLAADFPDPSVLDAGGCYYAYATSGPGGKVQVAVSRDLRSWSGVGDAMPETPAWALDDAAIWAPEAIKAGGKYLLFFSARHRRLRVPLPARVSDAARPCIGVAVSSTPGGPFRPEARPLICAAFREGVIDPSPFRDADGSLYIYFKRDGNCCFRWPAAEGEAEPARRPAELYGQRLAPGGLRPAGGLTSLGVADAGHESRRPEDWPGQVVEAPTMTRVAGRYVLFYSGDWYLDDRYGIGFAVCNAPLGPCSAQGPLLRSQSGPAGALHGPGHQAIIGVGRRAFLLFHAWYPEAPRQGEALPCRVLMLAELSWTQPHPGDLQPELNSISLPRPGLTCRR